MSAHEQGYQAGKAGEPEYRCPYKREGNHRRHPMLRAIIHMNRPLAVLMSGVGR